MRLSNDLRAFDGRPAAARCAGAVELAVRRVRRQQRSAALTVGAIAVTIALASVLLLGWRRYEAWQLAYVAFAAEQGPLIAEMFDQDGLPVTGAVTVPTQQPLAAPVGDYRYESPPKAN